MIYSFKIQDIFSKFPEFLTLQRLAHKLRSLGLSWAIPDSQNSFFELVRKKILCSNFLSFY